LYSVILLDVVVVIRVSVVPLSLRNSRKTRVRKVYNFCCLPFVLVMVTVAAVKQTLYQC